MPNFSRAFLPRMFLGCLCVFEWKSRRSLVCTRLPTNLPIAAGKECTPEPNGGHHRVPDHSYSKGSMTRGQVPGISVEGGKSLEKGCNDQCGDGIWSLGIVVLCGHRFRHRGVQRDRSRQHHR